MTNKKKPKAALETSLAQCMFCCTMLNPKNLNRHIGERHRQALWKRVGGVHEAPQTPFVRCPRCKALVPQETWPAHVLAHTNPAPHPYVPRDPPQTANTDSLRYNPDDPEGVMILKALGRGQYYRAGHVERCDSCRRRVVFLDMGPDSVKAFDLSEDRIIMGTHACDLTERSESLRGMVQAGIIDSNRRKH